MAPFRFPVCPSCKKKNTIDLAQLTSTQTGFKDYQTTGKRRRREYFISCQHCNTPFKFILDEDKSDEIKKG
jgi:hypothetical protein